jgi:ATP-dependent Lhr-like helicase
MTVLSGPVGKAPLPLGEATRAWFERAFGEPTRVQREGWETIARGEDALLIAPTGSGKTLAAFLVAIDRLLATPADRPGWRAVYISPLKALVYDVERNLGTPLSGIGVVARHLGLEARELTVDVRTGDTPQSDRARQNKRPGDILVTTPESLYLLLTSDARRYLRSVETLIIDEIHALAPTKRGVHLALSVERLAALTHKPLQRIGLSATVRPAEEVARFLSGTRPCAIVDTAAPPRLDLEVSVPVDDMTKPHLSLALEPGAILPNSAQNAAKNSGEIRDPKSGPLLTTDLTPRERASLWPAIEPKILELVLAHRSTIIFVNSRGLAERLAQRLNELATAAMGDAYATLTRAHHGSVAHAQRKEIEELLKSGALRAIVATSSLELGIDMGAVDLVIQVESPDSSARGLQRVGRAGHQVGGVSRGRIFPKHRNDLLEATVVSRMMQEGHIESLKIPKSPLDVLAQHIVAMVAMESIPVSELFALVRRAHPYRELSEDVFHSTLEMLTGRFPSTEIADLRPRLSWDRAEDKLEARKSSRLLAVVNGGTIPDRGLYGVFLAGSEGQKKPVRVGELDEEMVHEARVGETFLLGATSWRIQEITRDKVLVTPAPGEPGKMPFWKGDGPGRPLETGRIMGAFVRRILELGKDADRFLMRHYPLDEKARKNLLAHLEEQRDATGLVPDDKTIVIERFKDELGDFRLCILSPFGARVHAPWAMALEEVIGQRTGHEVQAIYTDDGIALRFANADRAPGWDELWIEPSEIEDRIIERLGTSAMFSGIFRENAARALLLPRKNPEGRAPLWQQRLRAQSLLAAVRQFSAFPIILETYRTCLQDIFDLPALRELLSAIERREVKIHEVDTRDASPFSRSLAYAYIANYMYEVDNPVAERRAQALSLDRNLLRQLLGEDELRSLFSDEVLTELESELQGLVPPFRATDADRLHDLLHRVGALDEPQILARCDADKKAVEGWLESLLRARRVVKMRVGNRMSYVAVEDCALYRDSLGAAPPAGLPASLLLPVADALTTLILRYGRTHAPFTAEEIARYLDLPVLAVEPILVALTRKGRLSEGQFRPGGQGQEYCETEVLRRLRRRMLARLRDEVAPVDGPTLSRFLIGWQGVGATVRSPQRLLEICTQLEGLALPFSELEDAILPTRVPGTRPRELDDLTAMGHLVWVGAGAIGQRDGRVALYRRENAAKLIRVNPLPEDAHLLERALHAHLSERGAAFFAELLIRVGQVRGANSSEVAGALWALVWRGLVTNDTFVPLRELREGRSGMGGRWSLVGDLCGNDISPSKSRATDYALAKIHGMLERWGMICSEIAKAEDLEGGLGSIYEGLKMMEDLGKVRRGHFVDGLGIQFALPGVVDRLRGARDPASHPRDIDILASTDPGNPWGLVLPWPAVVHPGETAPKLTPKRAVQTFVVVSRGAPVMWVGSRGQKLLSFASLREDPRLAVEVFRALLPRLRALGSHPVLEIDGRTVRGSSWEPSMREAGFVGDYRGMIPSRETSKPSRAYARQYAPPSFEPPTAVVAEARAYAPPSFGTPASSPPAAPIPDLGDIHDKFARRFAFRRARRTEGR